MKKTLNNIGGLILFYSVIVIGVLLLNMRFSYLNAVNTENVVNTYISMKN